MDQLLTVIIQTSPIPSHPSTALLDALFRSFNRVNGIRECRIIISCDGCDEEETADEVFREGRQKGIPNYKHGKVSEDAKTRYKTHLRHLRGKLGEDPFHGPVEIIELPYRHGSARAVDAVFSSVRTPFVMVAQHDNLFVKDISLRDLLSVMETNSGWLKCVHFQATSTIDYVNKVQRRYGLRLETRDVEGLAQPLVPLAFWYGRTHIARADYYREFVLNRPLRLGDHLEELLGVQQLNEMLAAKELKDVHRKYGNYVLNEDEEVLYHVSGRRVHAAEQCNDANTCVGFGNGHDAIRTEIDGTVCNNRTSLSSGPVGSSFTTARSCLAIVPGLSVASSEMRRDCGAAKPRGRFRQSCFHCGAKGHSKKWCPDIQSQAATKTIDFSTR
mmetsp:Transcript_18366/g.52985  ORF Transcript_18366/g.52985 Transcript_18366/m.52985 type:complete len:387 (-) Transcript_18366:336-1496(-)|eukprot:CAMPEP_0113553078 /NCGR_PEP_ID=MMETSP0015_2-20120614/15415_1 /TAXON_ID=2838 /ORGANISM="Odontella" /LENGTH=386 /DNA_ID=CAMNT_0000454111 /DNA_START=151 /DNA_END=1311 /DNA_ORIENTATION=+ /assembly_acc=CAM_ASM_000160